MQNEDVPPWTPCPDCDEYWCNIHQEHAADCDCPPLDEWETDPYSPPSANVLGPAAF
jgi:hypothetical protein